MIQNKLCVISQLYQSSTWKVLIKNAMGNSFDADNLVKFYHYKTLLNWYTRSVILFELNILISVLYIHVPTENVVPSMPLKDVGLVRFEWSLFRIRMFLYNITRFWNTHRLCTVSTHFGVKSYLSRWMCIKYCTRVLKILPKILAETHALSNSKWIRSVKN